MPSTISTVPWSLGTDAESIRNVSPSMSVSFGKTSIVTAVSSCVVAASSFATGASLTGVTSTFTVVDSDTPPEVTM
ncbi:hypothetical protein EAF56_24925 [Vibrio alginolyticus]|uniref:Uncharacterized protein n=1 Tax=Vibrio alginolyticus TaxID=663 RepID=A0AA36UUP3_VIBAL|nr:hypothetical protein [Vibrio alginolyticus]EGR1299205.1 hypothetical protein [Vibrio alginolyticus]